MTKKPMVIKIRSLVRRFLVVSTRASNSQETQLFQSVHYKFLCMVCYTIPSIFLFLAIFQLKGILLCENLVIKALTNLMERFIFFAPNKLEPLCHLCCICLHLYVGISRTMLSWGTFSTLHLYFVHSRYHALLSMDVTGVK